MSASERRIEVTSCYPSSESDGCPFRSLTADGGESFCSIDESVDMYGPRERHLVPVTCPLLAADITVNIEP